jgi:hypothetical protein
MGFLTNIIAGTIKTCITPVTVVADSLDVLMGEEPTNTKKVIKSTKNSFKKAEDSDSFL